MNRDGSEDINMYYFNMDQLSQVGCKHPHPLIQDQFLNTHEGPLIEKTVK